VPEQAEGRAAKVKNRQNGTVKILAGICTTTAIVWQIFVF